MSQRNQAGQPRASAPGPERPGWPLLVAGGLIYAGALLGMWIVLARQPDVQDLVAGSAAAVLAVGVGYLVSQRGKMVPSVRVADLRMLAAVPWRLMRRRCWAPVAGLSPGEAWLSSRPPGGIRRRCAH